MPDTVFSVIASGLDNIARAAELSAETISDAADSAVDAARRVDESGALDFTSGITTGGSGGGETGIGVTGKRAVSLTPGALITELERAMGRG